MKASDFLNKTKEEIQTQLDILLQSEQMQDENLMTQIFLAQTLLTNDVVFKQSASTKEGRLQLLTLAEVLKGINGVLKVAEEKNLSDEEINEAIMNKLPVAELNAQARAIEYDDVEEDVKGADIYEVRDFCKETILTMLSIDDDDFDEADKKLITKAFDKLFGEAIHELGYENKASFTEKEMNDVFMRIGDRMKEEEFDFEDYVNDEDDNQLN